MRKLRRENILDALGTAPIRGSDNVEDEDVFDDEEQDQVDKALESDRLPTQITVAEKLKMKKSELKALIEEVLREEFGFNAADQLYGDMFTAIKNALKNNIDYRQIKQMFRAAYKDAMGE